MTKTDIREKVFSIVQSVIGPETTLEEEVYLCNMGCDPMDLDAIATMIEDEFHVEISDRDRAEICTIVDIVERISAKLR